MSDEGPGVAIPEATATTNGHGNGDAVLDDLRAKRRRLAEKRELIIDIPGYGGTLVARYKPTEMKTIRKIQERAAKSNSDRVDVLAAADILIAMLDEVLIRKSSGLVPLVDEVEEFGSEPVRFDPRLAETLEIEGKSAREVVIGLFEADKPETGNDVILNDHADKVVDWLRSVDSEVDTDF